MKVNDLKKIIKSILSEMVNMKDDELNVMGFVNVEEESGTGAVAGFSPPFAGGPRRKKKKVRESNFLNKVKEKIRTSVNTDKTMANEKTNPDGTYVDDMLNGQRDTRFSTLEENTISFTPQLFRKLKIEYNKAIRENKKSFIFEGQEMLVSYAKYLIQYLEPRFAGIREETSSGAVFSGGPTIQTPGWVSKNPEGTTQKFQRGQRVISKDGRKGVVFNAGQSSADGHWNYKIIGDHGEDFIAIEAHLTLDKPSSLDEETSSGAVFSGGPTIQTPAWGTKNKLGSPGAIKASKSLGYKVVKSISEKSK